MADPKLGEPFGIAQDVLLNIDWKCALKRVIHDIRTDFIYAPHLHFIYDQAGDEIIAQLNSTLKNGTYYPGVPVTIEVPKSFRVRVTPNISRLGPNFSRPGSILLPHDRLLYQALADNVAPIIDSITDHERSFSHKLAPPGTASMFLPTRICWNEFQKALEKHSAQSKTKYILKIDVANFFGSLNQHTLINILTDAGLPKALSSRIEILLTSYTGERSSRGILQGMYPSDLFGNFYMMPVDRFLDDLGVPSARYVDDTYIFVESADAADRLAHELIPFLRSYDLVLNEAKCVLIPKAALNTEEPDLQKLFDGAVDEISAQVNAEDFHAEYGFQAEWDDESSENESEDLTLEATKVLFNSVTSYPGNEENIERFCLPLFAKANSDYALNHVVAVFKTRPAMAQVYAFYLSKFLNDVNVKNTLLQLVQDSSLVDWQRMWALGALLQTEADDDHPVKIALGLVKDASRHDVLRAVAAIYVGARGDMIRRKSLITLYPHVSSYVRAAIFYSARTWPPVERANAKANWGSHGLLNSLITIAMNKK